MRRALAAALLVLGAAAAAPAPHFAFDPKPRWTEDPETEVVCAAIRAECAGFLKEGGVEAEWGYAEVYDADGRLIGLRSVRSTGCKPLDEHLLLGQRRFRGAFSKPGAPDLEGIVAELAPGTPKSAVRLVKSGSTTVSMGC